MQGPPERGLAALGSTLQVSRSSNLLVQNFIPNKASYIKGSALSRGKAQLLRRVSKLLPKLHRGSRNKREIVVRRAKASWKVTSSRLGTGSDSSPLACPHFYPFGISAGLEDEQWGPIVPASPRRCCLHCLFKTVQGGTLQGAFLWGTWWKQGLQALGEASLIWSQPR